MERMFGSLTSVSWSTQKNSHAPDFLPLLTRQSSFPSGQSRREVPRYLIIRRFGKFLFPEHFRQTYRLGPGAAAHNNSVH